MLLTENEFLDLIHVEVKSAFKEAMKDLGIQMDRTFHPFPQTRYLTRKQVADYLGIGLSTVDYWARIGRLNKVFIEDTPRFDKEEIDKGFSKLKKFSREG